MKKTKIGVDESGLFVVTVRKITLLLICIACLSGMESCRTSSTNSPAYLCGHQGGGRASWHALIMPIAVKAIIKANGTLCTATTVKGQPCKNQALNGQTTCYFHSPSSQCAGKKADGTKCRALHLKDSKFCKWHQDQK